MKHRTRQNGLTLTELVVVVAVVAILLGISVPTAQKIMDSFEHSAGTRSLIDAALSSARAMAVSNNTPTGVRFQQDRNGDFYMIFIYHKDVSWYAWEFLAFPNRKPMKLPEDIGVLAGTVSSDADLYTPAEWMNAQTFSVVFSEQGRMILCSDVHVLNKDGVLDDSSRDPIFNTKSNVDGNIAGMFYQDEDDSANGLEQESSVNAFYIYEKKRMNETPANQRFTGLVQGLQKEFVNPYSGQLIKK